MTRLLSALILLFSSCFALAQSAPEPPAEHASAATVILFIVLFVGACVGYFLYLWWDAKKAKQRDNS